MPVPESPANSAVMPRPRAPCAAHAATRRGPGRGGGRGRSSSRSCALDDVAAARGRPSRRSARSAAPAARGPRRSGRGRRADTSATVIGRPAADAVWRAVRAARSICSGLSRKAIVASAGSKRSGASFSSDAAHSSWRSGDVRDRHLDDERRLARPVGVPVAGADQEHRTRQLGERAHGGGRRARRGSRPARRPGPLRAASPRATPPGRSRSRRRRRSGASGRAAAPGG